ncbi:hypothetical protein MATL_G00151270 [Megalops atlanticus]|uniref:Phospholipase A1 member A n=1 Tax=Megalops atlanticus TaxID=7932 RepID=A0A9D3T318_MEGAT|nr:hypothetical protein MATL_G00151270 [Megalops atlanticus]
MALLRSTVLSFLAILRVYASSTAAGNHTVSTAECADLSNTTWSEYRQGGKLEVQYLLLTRSNMDCATVFSKESLSDPQRPSPFNSSLPTKVIIHGYRALGTKPSWVKTLAQGLLQAEDVNVLVVDWVYGASFAYNLVVQNYKEVAVQISVLINELITHGSKLESFHFIGVSLGAHVSGFVGTLFRGKVGRITGLDPAGPMFKRADVYDRLDPSDALFVEAIHTDSDYFGISIPVGHVDFFLNGGMDQAGCARSQFASILAYFPVYGYVICDHMRAVHVYISALNNSWHLPTNRTFGEKWDHRLSLPYEEKVFLLTSASAPFCAHHILVELEVSPLEKSAEVQVTLSSAGYPEMERKLRMSTKENVYGTVMASPVPLCKLHSIQLKNTGSRFYRQGDIRFQSVCISELPRKRETDAVCVNTIYLGRSFPWSHDFVLLCGSY